MTGAFVIMAAIALFGGLMGGGSLACVLRPFRGRTDPLPRSVFVTLFGATCLAGLPAMAVFLGLIDYEAPATLLLFFGTGAITALPLFVPAERLPRDAPLIFAGFALATLSALATLFWASQGFRDARESLHRACSAATETRSAARACRTYVDTHWSLPADLPQT